MTCIIGLVHNGKIYMGCDSMSAADWSQRQTLLPKVFIKDKFIIGYSWSFRMGQLIQYNLELPEYDGKIEPLQYMVTKFIPAVRLALKEGGYTEIENNREKGGEFLVGFDSNLFRVASDFQVNQYKDGFDAIGCGAEYALGAMEALFLKYLSQPEKMILEALKISAHFSNGVMEPFHIDWI